MDFDPKTWVYFCKTGIDEYNKVVCKNQTDLFNISGGGSNQLGVLSDTSFQRADGYFIVRVDHTDIPYYKLLQADTVIYRNDGTDGNFWIWCNIISVEWKNPDCSFVKFKIDHFMTYQDKIDWENTYAFIEREHVKEDWSSDGGNPLFSNIGPAEDFGTVADTPVFTWNKNFALDRVLIQSPYDESAKPVFGGDIENGLYSGMYTDSYTPNVANNMFNKIAESKDASINNIVGVYGFPNEFAGSLIGTIPERTETLPAMHIACRNHEPTPEYNNSKCYSAPFMNIRLMSSDGDFIDFTPQWFGNDIEDYTFLYKCVCSGKQFGGLAGTFKNKNGLFDWKVWNDFTVMISELPRVPWTADGFTDWQSYSMLPLALKAAASGGRIMTDLVRGGIHAATPSNNSTPVTRAAGLGADVLDGVNSYVDTLANLGAQILQQRATGATTQGAGTYSMLFDIGQEAWGFKVLYYSTQPYVMKSVDSYFDRFGYRVNQLKKLEIENRPIWTFVKTAECHVLSKEGIPFISETMINRMFNHGVTMWTLDKYKSGIKPGDFSRAHDNRGIKG